MERKDNTNHVETDDHQFTENNSVCVKNDALQPGEKGFTLIFFMISCYFLYHAVLLYQKSPGASSYGAIPLFVCIIISILLFVMLVTGIKKPTVNASDDHSSSLPKVVLNYVLPKNLTVILAFIVLYCIALGIGVGFYIATPVFLWASMCFLMKKDYVKNILWMALCMVFIWGVFSLLFSVVLP